MDRHKSLSSYYSNQSCKAYKKIAHDILSQLHPCTRSWYLFTTPPAAQQLISGPLKRDNLASPVKVKGSTCVCSALIEVLLLTRSVSTEEHRLLHLPLPRIFLNIFPFTLGVTARIFSFYYAEGPKQVFST